MMSNSAEYDIIFAGGGPCSCIAASRLLEADSSLKILIIECGEHTHNIARHIQPARYMGLLVDPTVFHYHVGKPSPSLGGRSPIVPSGKTVGGGSTVNFMAYTRGAASDYDDWETIHGNKGWGSSSLIPLLKEAETYQETDFNGTHGSQGPIKVSFAPDMVQLADAFLDVAKRYDKGREPTNDVNGFYECNKYGRWARYVDKDTGRRSDVPHHYIYRKPENPNLTIITKNVVDTVIIESGQAVGVRCRSLDDPNASTLSARAAKLVVLGAGAFGSPAILERSGIGSSRILKQLGILQLVDLPGVGENYMDHLTSHSEYLGTPEIETLDEIIYADTESVERHEKVWSETGKGLMAHNGLDAMVKMRPDMKDLKAMSPDLDEYWSQYFEGSPDKPLMCLYPLAFGVGRSPPINFSEKIFGLSFLLAYPASTGYIHIANKDAAAPQKDFHPGFLDHPADVAAVRWIYKKSREFARRMKCYRGENAANHPTFDAPSLAAIVPNDTPRDCNEPEIVYTAEDDKRIDEYFRKRVQTAWHSCGTCAMKPREKGGVVDDRLNVYGVRGLKVADCSIFPGNVGANIYNTAIAIGQKAAVLIAEDLGLRVGA
ncbi:GMC oxidoreductase-domain-containing protein [Panaeolus papilionaceus]|nr:GMC oxidoreductase-domain-containing protein [Panaeolus papilionaceus]